MCSRKRYLWIGMKLLVCSMMGLLLITVRSLLRTPQPLESVLPGVSRLYKWGEGYIFYRVAGAEDAPPVVLFHRPGPGASSYEMRGMMEELVSRYRVYALDLLGFGLSDHPGVDYSADIYLRLYRDFLTAVVARPAILLASGLSCQYCLALAAQVPALCERLILLSPASLHQRRRWPRWLSRLVGGPPLHRVIYALLTMRPVLRMLVAWQYGVSSVTGEDLDYISAAAHQLGGYRAALAFITGKLALNVAHDLSKVSQPALIFCDLRSQWLVQNALKQHVSIQNARIQVQNGQPETVMARILMWLSESTERPVTTTEDEGDLR